MIFHLGSSELRKEMILFQDLGNVFEGSLARANYNLEIDLLHHNLFSSSKCTFIRIEISKMNKNSTIDRGREW